MRVQEHIKLSTAAAIAALPWLKRDVCIPLAASILIDVDHYLWHAVTYRTLSLKAARQYFKQANPPRLAQQRLLHQPVILGALLVVAALTRSRILWLILAGLAFHVSLDTFHARQTKRLKRTLTEQANFTCPACGQHFEDLQLHTIRAARNILDRYNARHFMVLCPACHEKAHKKHKAVDSTATSFRLLLRNMI
jgi:hypothetical protein